VNWVVLRDLLIVSGLTSMTIGFWRLFHVHGLGRLLMRPSGRRVRARQPGGPTPDGLMAQRPYRY